MDTTREVAGHLVEEEEAEGHAEEGFLNFLVSFEDAFLIKQTQGSESEEIQLKRKLIFLWRKSWQELVFLVFCFIRGLPSLI